jgi:hypothetical protein
MKVDSNWYDSNFSRFWLVLTHLWCLDVDGKNPIQIQAAALNAEKFAEFG